MIISDLQDIGLMETSLYYYVFRTSNSFDKSSIHYHVAVKHYWQDIIDFITFINDGE